MVTALPIEDQEFGEIDKTTWIWYIACAGAFLGFCGSTWLTRMTELAWPLQTGNMPIVAWWPNLIVIFEMTMLGSILATVITLIVSSGLGRRMPRLYDPEVTDGKILVGVARPSEAAVPDLERALRAAGARNSVAFSAVSASCSAGLSGPRQTRPSKGRATLRLKPDPLRRQR